jgi:hypothetical protein
MPRTIYRKSICHHEPRIAWKRLLDLEQ